MDEDTIIDLLQDLGPVRIRRMFGGLGVFLDGLMIAVTGYGGELYIKADALNDQYFRDAGSTRFTYLKAGGKPFVMGYWKLPDEALDDPVQAVIWAKYGLEAAQRAARKKTATGKRVSQMPEGAA